MSSEFGSLLKISVFGQSHGRAIGVVVDGLPAGEAIDLEELNAFLARRKPGKSPLSTARREADAPVFSPAWKTASPVEPLCARSSKMETSTHRTMMPCRTSPGPATQTTLHLSSGAGRRTCGAAATSPAG